MLASLTILQLTTGTLVSFRNLVMFSHMPLKNTATLSSVEAAEISP